MELGHWLLIDTVGIVGIVGGFCYMISGKSYNLARTPVSVAVMFLGGLILLLGGAIQEGEDYKQCVRSGGEWLGKDEYDVATKTYVTKYNCYTLKGKS